MTHNVRRAVYIAFFAFFQLFEVESHSWLACTDYAEKNAATWNPSKCRGFPRMAHVKVNKDRVFGGDNGYDHRPSESNACNFGFTDNSYTSDHPMAVYYPGQQVVLVHPMKNHGADGACGTIWMPDTGSALYAVRAQRRGAPDPSLSQFRQHPIFDLGRSPSGHDFGGNVEMGSIYPKPGFANAPNFCVNTDKSLATYSFNVPKNMRPGLYSFIWTWSFNSANDLYSTCFEVEVVPNKRTRDTNLRARGVSDLTEPCGGVTSNPKIMGNSNPGCTRSSQNGPNEYRVVPGETTTPPPTTTTLPTTTSTDSYERSTEWTSYTQRPTSYTQAPVVNTNSPTSNTNPPDYYYPDNNQGYGNGQESGSESGSESRRPPDRSNIRLSIPIHMRSTQFSGEMWLPAARDNTIRRYISVDFTCRVDIASFWNCRTISDPEESRLTNHYDLVQRGSRELETNYIFYHVSFSEACDLSLHAPVARLVQEDFL